MKKHLIYLIMFICVLPCFISCGGGEEHFITDSKYRELTHNKFLERKELAKGREKALFSVFDRNDMTTARREALEFLYAYMPLCDLANYDGEFFLNQVDGALRAREYFDWGKKVPEEIFRHFVLVHRINNEYLDESRDVFFEELKDRVKGMSMTEAALEVNHWCHEKVNYRATDARTSAPLALVRTSWGRCGEESTFTASAMRAVGIPARQCYTPRWVHTDDNHAWVEIWVDGEWHYLGACEPEPVLDAAWFTGPAKRAMMVHTNVQGDYYGPEEKNHVTKYISRINSLSTYTQTRKLNITVMDEVGNPVPEANIRFKVYNYATFTSISDAVTDNNGKSSLTTGMGDILVWADKDGKYGYAKNSFADNDMTVVLNKTAGEAYKENLVMNVPPEQPIDAIPEELVEANRIRLVQEDSIRGSYMATFASEDTAAELASRTGLNKEKVYKNLHTAQGNWKDIYRFMEENKDNPLLFDFLASMREKDLRDTPADYLNDHLNGRTVIPKGLSPEMAASKILSPRIGYELIRPWRVYFLNEAGLPKAELTSGEAIKNYVVKNIRIVDGDENYVNCILTPMGVHEIKLADNPSRDIYFVALCRSLGIPAHLEQATGKPQYYENGIWHDAIFVNKTVETIAPKGKLTVKNSTSNIIKPSYGTHFTISKFDGADFQPLNYRSDETFGTFPATVMLDEGYYRVLTGSRANDGSVAVSTEYFNIGPKNPYTVEIKLPELENKLFVKGIIDMNTTVTLNDGDKKSLKEISNNKGLILCFADPDKEPTKHILQDIPAQRGELEEWGGGILFMVPDDRLSSSFDPGVFKGLPKQVTWGTDFDRVLLNQAISVMKVEFKNNFPVTVYLSSNGGVLYSSTGYRIGIGEDLLKVILQEQATMK